MKATQRLRLAAEINHFAEEEGWGLFNAELAPEIQRIDESETFPGDDAAREHVLKLAEAGSYLHELAVKIVDDAAAVKEEPPARNVPAAVCGEIYESTYGGE